jgi:hypothetical protein
MAIRRAKFAVRSRNDIDEIKNVFQKQTNDYLNTFTQQHQQTNDLNNDVNEQVGWLSMPSTLYVVRCV